MDPRSVTPSFQQAMFADENFWKHIPAYSSLAASDFMNPEWQSRNSVRTITALKRTLQHLVSDDFFEDVATGIERSPMALRVTPYIIALIDWASRADPIRRQFIPLGSEYEPDHPKCGVDPLAERLHSAVPGLIRRYADKALFLPLNTCPVYCRFCTRSYAVGLDTPHIAKADLRIDRSRWAKAFRWLKETPEVEDVVVSGGDAYNLSADALAYIGRELLGVPSIRRIRIATRGMAVLPSRINRDNEWTQGLLEIVRDGRKQSVAVSLHTHFNHPREITWATVRAAEFLFSEGVTMRNQTVLLRGVNDDVVSMQLLIKRLGRLHIQPYYVYLHDLVPGVETLRTPLQSALDLEIALRGRTAGFLTPSFVVDLPHGGGKRIAHSYESYDRPSGISVFRSPAIDPSREYRYYDPIRC